MISFEKYLPKKTNHEINRIEKLFFDNNNGFFIHYLSEKEIEILIEKIKSQNITQKELKNFLYNMEKIEKVLKSEEYLAQLIGKINIVESEKLKNIEFYFYRTLIKYYNRQLITDRLRQMGKLVLYKLEDTDNKLKIKIRGFLNSNLSFISFIESEYSKYSSSRKLDFAQEFLLYSDEEYLINNKHNLNHILEINKELL